MLVKIHKSYRRIVAVCDSDLIGKKYNSVADNGTELQIDLTGEFFKGEEKNADEVREIIEDCQREDATFFIVGKESVGLCKEIGMITTEGVREIGSVPVGLVLL